MIKIPDINITDFIKYFRECMFEKNGNLYYFERVGETFDEDGDLDNRTCRAIKMVEDVRDIARFGPPEEFATSDLMGDLNVFQFPESMGWRSAFNGKFLGHFRYSAHGGRSRGFNHDAFNCWNPPETTELLLSDGIDYETFNRNIASAYWLLKRPSFVPLKKAIHEMLEGRSYGAAVSPSIALVLSGSSDSSLYPIKLFVDRKVVGKVGLDGEIFPVATGLSRVLDSNLKKVA